MEKIGEKRPAADDHQGILSDVKALLVEGDGTVTPLSFFKEKLCGYAKESVEDYLTLNFKDDEVKDLVEGLRKQSAADSEAGTEDVITIPAVDAPEADIIKAVVDIVKGQLGKGKMSEPLRKLVGSILHDGYKKKAITGELFDDVVPALKELTEQGTRVYVFSSRCSDSQRLLFAYSKDGDQSELISGYFDATAGPRTEKDTYVKLAKDLELSPSDVMYLTHQSTEATAAHAAGMKTALVIRAGNPNLSDKDKESYLTISSFSELFGERLTELPPKKVCHEHPSPKKSCHTTHATHAQ